MVVRSRAEVNHTLDRYLPMVRKGAVGRILDGTVAVAEIAPLARPAR
jgi:hypothetical protein